MKYSIKNVRSYFFHNVRFFDEYLDDAIVGKDNNGRPVYVWSAMEDCYMKAHNCDREEATEMLYYTVGIEGAAGGDVPTICYDI